MYYTPSDDPNVWPPVNYISLIESKDGINWTKPSLDIFDHPELKVNNVVLEGLADSASFFYDNNPSCPAEEKYKAIGKTKGEVNGEEKEGLWCWTSADGYNFKLTHFLTDKGHFDSLNTIVWQSGRYTCFFRGFHNIIPGGEISWATRDVRVMHSDDFKNWSDPKMIKFSDNLDYALYTNNALPYERASQYIVGFPTRYFERKGWTENIKQMPSYGTKVKAAESYALQVDKDRTGLVNTDCIFMFSRDGGDNWHRYSEAFYTPGYENESNWVYGDCYPSYNLVDLGDENYYFYDVTGHLSHGEPKSIYRYAIRKDGFAYATSGGEEGVIVTKPLIFDGKYLHLNFSTSAYGYIYIDILDEEGNEISGRSFEIYGDNIDRKITFEDGSDFSAFAGRPVRIRFKILDAKLYSMKFE
ncbi:MAG: hypothetical protein IJZ03_09025 [Clostridia bacterium]|nr:hypothetical protein [Clostridia bacterium]MBQ8743492.1 hypothetical protein [Clostridia bacterium]